MNPEPAKSPPETLSDIESAIRALSKADLNRLSIYARWLFNYSSISSRLEFQAPDELINEAIVRTLLGKRRWTTTKPLVDHLMGVMKSCVFHAANSARARTERFDRTDMVEEGTREYASEGLENAVLETESDAECAAVLDELAEHFSSDNDAAAVLEGWKAGFSGPDIMDLHSLTRNNLESAAKRIRRYAIAKAKRGSP